jgi:hypothetical protein
MWFLIWQFMKKSVWRSNPADAKRIFEDLLKSQ